jgi:hypothetical protein
VNQNQRILLHLLFTSRLKHSTVFDLDFRGALVGTAGDLGLAVTLAGPRFAVDLGAATSGCVGSVTIVSTTNVGATASDVIITASGTIAATGAGAASTTGVTSTLYGAAGAASGFLPVKNSTILLNI